MRATQQTFHDNDLLGPLLVPNVEPEVREACEQIGVEAANGLVALQYLSGCLVVPFRVCAEGLDQSFSIVPAFSADVLLDNLLSCFPSFRRHPHLC